MAIAAIPSNQQDALPLQSIAQATSGSIVTFGNKLARYFDPVTLGINAVGISQQLLTGGAVYYYIATNWLDLRGCSQFAFMLQRNVNVNKNPILNTRLNAQYRMGVTDNPPAVYDNNGNPDEGRSGQLQLVSTNPFSFVAQTSTDPQRELRVWTSASVNQGTNQGGSITIGYDVRLIITWTTVNPNVGDSTFTAQLWAQE